MAQLMNAGCECALSKAESSLMGSEGLRPGRGSACVLGCMVGTLPVLAVLQRVDCHHLASFQTALLSLCLSLVSAVIVVFLLSLCVASAQEVAPLGLMRHWHRQAQ